MSSRLLEQLQHKNFYVSHGSATWFLRTDKKYYIYFIDNLLLFTTVKEFSKLVNSWWSYHKKVRQHIFSETQCSKYLQHETDTNRLWLLIRGHHFIINTVYTVWVKKVDPQDCLRYFHLWWTYVTENYLGYWPNVFLHLLHLSEYYEFYHFTSETPQILIIQFSLL